MKIENMIISRLKSLEIITTTLLYQTGNKLSGDKNTYVTNSIAKAQSLVKSIELTYSGELYNESWILYRCLLDRYLYLRYLAKNKLHEDFKNWSFTKGYEYLQNAKSEESTENVKRDPRFRFSKEQSKTYSEVKKQSSKFPKPDPKSEFKEEGLNFLYKLGYDYASMRVHPMFEDGDEEYYRITKVEPNPYSDFSHEKLITNTYLVASMIIQESLNQIDLNTISIVYEYLENLRANADYEIAFYKIIKTVEQGGNIFEK